MVVEVQGECAILHGDFPTLLRIGTRARLCLLLFNNRTSGVPIVTASSENVGRQSQTLQAIAFGRSVAS